MLIRLILILVSAYLISCTRVRQKKEKPDGTTDPDYEFMENEIFNNNIRNFYDTTAINTTIYMKTLKAAHTFASGMFQGIHIEVEGKLYHEIT